MHIIGFDVPEENVYDALIVCPFALSWFLSLPMTLILLHVSRKPGPLLPLLAPFPPAAALVVFVAVARTRPVVRVRAPQRLGLRHQLLPAHRPLRLGHELRELLGRRRGLRSPLQRRRHPVHHHPQHRGGVYHVCHVLSLDVETCRDSLRNLTPVRGRQHPRVVPLLLRHRLRDGIDLVRAQVEHVQRTFRRRHRRRGALRLHLSRELGKVPDGEVLGHVELAHRLARRPRFESVEHAVRARPHRGEPPRG
mmetsp:Transcript_1799/g.7498  ORF Transcript_1799/g.7498 Transcript_1799/m.7498 type:complete len:251 (-) Transcript_1799:249-1001(-)